MFLVTQEFGKFAPKGGQGKVMGGFFGKTAILESFGKNLVVRSGCASHRPSSGLVSKRINFC